MIPEPGETLRALANRLLTHVVPDAQSQFVQADTALIAELLGTLAQDYERALDNRLQDIQEMRVLFASCTDAPGAVERASFTEAAPASYTLPHVTALHATGFELLVELHAWAEEHDPHIDREVWSLLRRHAQRNAFEMSYG